MNKIKSLRAVAACVVAFAVSFLSGTGWGKSFSLDLRNQNTAAKSYAANHSGPSVTFETDGVLRTFDLDAGVADVGEVAVGDELTFTLFDDVTITLTLKTKASSPLGGDVFLAEASGYGGVKNAVVLRTEDGLTIDVQDYHNAKMYKVISTASGVTVREQDASRTGTCGCESEGLTGLDADAAPHEATAGTINGVPVSRSSDPAFVDVLVAYDANAKAWAEANGGGMLTFAQLAVQKMNTVLYNNELYDAFRFQLVGVVDVSVSSASLGDVLNAAVNGTGGWAPIKAKRDAVGADIVTVLVDTGSAYGTTGLGMSLDRANYDADSFSERPYNVCSIRSVAQSHTMTHEVGHNMGCGHAKEQTSDPGPQLFSYSAGYYYSLAGKWYHTIMAYSGECPYGTATQSPYFSDCYVEYIDSETGLSFCPGDEQHYNQFTLYKTYEMASNWRASKGIEGESGYISDELKWWRTSDDPLNKAKAEGKKVFIVCGSDTCGYTQATREACALPTVKRLLDQNFICWYVLYDSEWSKISKYYKGYSFGNTFPFMAVVDPGSGATLKVLGGPPTDGYYLENYANRLIGMLGDIPGVKYNLVRNPNGGTYQGKTTEIFSANGLQIGTGNYWTIGVPTRSGYTFDGWWTAATGGTKVYDAEGNCVVGTYWDSAKKYKYAGDLTVYAHWTVAAKYTLTRDPNGGTYQSKTTATVTTDGLVYGSGNFWSIGVPTRSGYTFDGWWTAASGGVKVYGADGNCIAGTYWNASKQYIYNGNLTVYAHWTVPAGSKYTLTRNPNGGTYQGKTTAIVTDSGLQVGTGNFWSIGVPTRSGYTFDGWWTAASGGVKVYGADGNCIAGTYWNTSKQYIYNGNLTVYAHWTVPVGSKYTLTRNPNGGTYQGKTTATVTANGLQTGTGNFWSIGMADRSGYAFDGWWTAASGGVRVYGVDGNCVAGTYWNASKQYIYNGNLTVYAHWRALSGSKYTLTRNPNGGTYQGKTTAIVTANGLQTGTGNFWSIGMADRSGYAFDGWWTAASGGVQVYGADGNCVFGQYWSTGKAYTYEGNLTVYAHWKALSGKKYTLTRDPNGGKYQNKTTAIVTENGLQTGTGNFWSIGMADRSGYAFDGWWTAASGGVKVYDASGNCVFGPYWSTGKAYTHEGDLTVYAHWRAISGKKYTLTRNPNGGKYQNKTTAIVTANGLQTGTGNYWSIGMADRSGYAFDGWWTAASGGVKVYGADGNCIFGEYWSSGKAYVHEGDLTVYAHWRALSGKKYTLTRDPNGGTYQGKTTAIVTANGLQTGTGNFWSLGVPTRSGYTFEGWWTAASGGVQVYGADGNCIFGEYWSTGKAYTYEGNLTVYAHWKASDTRYTLTINPNGGTYNGKTTATVIPNALAYGSTDYNSIGVPTRTGYKFRGWYTQASGGLSVYTKSGGYVSWAGAFWMPGAGAYNLHSDLVVYAQWEETLAEAVECPTLTFTTGSDSGDEDSKWYVSDINPKVGKSCAQSGTIGDSQETWMQTTVSGPGTISFYWYVESEQTYDGLIFYVDDNLIYTFWGTENSWTKKSYSITSSGTHTIKWSYKKDSSVSAGGDFGCVDQVIWTPSSANVSAQVVEPGQTADDGTEQSLVGAFDGAAVGAAGVAGIVALTVTADGEVSGKVLEDGLVRAIAADEVTLAVDESVPFRRVVATGDGWIAWQNQWKNEPWKAVAEPFAAAPVLVTPDGVALKFSSTGAVTATYGAYSCSSVLIPTASTPNSQLPTLNFSLFVYFPPKAGEFEGYAAEIPLVWDGAAFSAAR